MHPEGTDLAPSSLFVVTVWRQIELGRAFTQMEKTGSFINILHSHLPACTSPQTLNILEKKKQTFTTQKKSFTALPHALPTGFEQKAYLLLYKALSFISFITLSTF